jgi:proteasome lid subunit RPN8/RPN11
MKTSSIFSVLIVWCAANLSPVLSIGQTGAFEVKFNADSLAFTAQFRYSIESGNVSAAGAAHQFTWDSPTEVQLKFSNLEWTGEMTNNTKRNLILNLIIQGDAPGTLAFGMSESQFYKFRLQQKISKKVDIQIRAIMEDGNTLSADRPLVLTFTPSSPPPAPINDPEKKGTSEPTPQQVSSREDIAWADAKKSNTVQGYSRFLSEFPSPGGKYFNMARQAMIGVDILKKSVSQINDSTDLVVVSNLLKTPWIAVFPSQPKPLQGKFNKAQYAYEFSVPLRAPGIDSIRICDHNPQKKGARCLTHKVGVKFQPLAGHVELNTRGDSVRFTVMGGLAPFRWVFLDLGGWEKGTLEAIQSRDTSLAIKALGKTLEPGTYAVEIQDAESTFHKIEDQPLVIKKQIPLSWLIIGGIAAMLLLLALLIRSVVMLRQKRRRAALLRQAQSHTASSPLSEFASSPLSESNSVAPDIHEPTTHEISGTPGSDIKIRARFNTKAIEYEVFHNMVGGGYLYLPLHLDRHWQNSAIRTIYLHRDAIAEIGHYLHTENTSKIEENNKDIPEIGGMILGRFTTDAQRVHEVTIEKFVPIAAKSDNVKLEFLWESIARDLTPVQDKYPDLLLVGWFHTHPGHGLFLSPPDLSIQEHFREPYQMAMEIDSLSATLDTGFFTRQTDGSMNNAEHLKHGARWFGWREIEQFISRRS